MTNKKELIKKRIPRVAKLLHSCRERYYLFLGKHFPKSLIKTWYKHIYHRNIDLVNPKTLDEKINWMKLNSDISLWTRCADKYEVRHYVEECGLGYVLNDIWGIYESADEIDYSMLPDSFVLKTTNGGGGKQVLIVKDKSNLDINKTHDLLDGWLRQEVGYRYYEPQYFPIKPRIIAERYLEPDEGESSLKDYKLFCFNGTVYSAVLCSDRKFKESVHFSVYDMNWNKHPECIVPQFRTETIYPKPVSFGKMVEYSSVLSKGVPFVRIDWYEVDGQPVLSEMTFTPSGGFQHLFSDDYLLELGNQLIIPAGK